MADSTSQKSPRRWFQFGLKELGFSVALLAGAMASANWLVQCWLPIDGEVQVIAPAVAFLCITTCAFAALGSLFRVVIPAAYVGSLFGMMTIGPFLVGWTLIRFLSF